MTLQPPRTRRLGRCQGLTVYLVDGVLVRNTHDQDFTMGGNEAIYPRYVPPGEIWLDENMRPLDRMATLFHEIIERNAMIDRGMSYAAAHGLANKLEADVRRELSGQRTPKFDLGRVARWLRRAAPVARVL